ncbi:unnamed protein product [Orchesella dallaii]|uniref:Gustatory receptor n=1 Tax=Orchesella dallaii TaxID=48710 RepID=A0ABP1RQE0_9HEXA
MDIFRERYGFQRPLEKWVKILGVLSVVLAVIYSIVFLHNIMNLTTYPGARSKITKECIGINSPKCNGGLLDYHLTALQIRVASVVVAVARLGIEIWMCKTLLKAASHGDGSALKDWYWKRAVYTISDITFDYSEAMDIFRQRYGFQRPMEKWVKIAAVTSMVLGVIYSITLLYNVMIVTSDPETERNFYTECVAANSQTYYYCFSYYHNIEIFIIEKSLVVTAARLYFEVWSCKTLIKAASHGDGLALYTWWWKRLLYSSLDAMFGETIPEGLYRGALYAMSLTFYGSHVFALTLARLYGMQLALA